MLVSHLIIEESGIGKSNIPDNERWRENFLWWFAPKLIKRVSSIAQIRAKLIT